MKTTCKQGKGLGL